MNIIVTGASSGIGYETVKELAITGEHQIVAVSRNQIKLNILKEEVESTSKSKVHIVAYDLGNDDFSKLFTEIDNCLQLTNGNFVDILINNAGYLVNKLFAELTIDDWQKSFDVNLFGTVKLIKILFPYFNRKETSHIVNIASMGGVQGTIKFPGLSAYSASKASVNVLTESLAAEFENENIRTNALSLGAVQTEMLNKAFPDYKAPVTANQMGHYIADFALNGHKLMNGRIIEVSLSG